MIILHLIIDDKNQALEIIALLIVEKLILNTIISKKTVYKYKNRLIKKNQILIIGQTKGLLFYNDKLSAKYHYKIPKQYSVPSIYMNEIQTDYIREHPAKV